jgi:hypothetical protein
MFTAFPFLDDERVLMCHTPGQQVTDTVRPAEKPQRVGLQSIKILRKKYSAIS